MKKRLTVSFIFSTMYVVSMVFALPLSNNGNLAFSISQTNIQTAKTDNMSGRSIDTTWPTGRRYTVLKGHQDIVTENNKSHQLPVYSNASYVYTISESGADDGWKNSPPYDNRDSKDASLKTVDEKKPGGFPESVTATMLLLGTGLVGLFGVGRNKG